MSKVYEDLGKISMILGSQWGDEGKGKLVDILSMRFDIIARSTGGANAGHTIYIPEKHVFHLIPSGMMHKDKLCVIGNGVVLHIPTLLEELDTLENSGISTEGRLKISDRAHIVLDYHKKVDELQEEAKGGKKVGTTKRGIGPAYTDKVRRNGVRVHELLEFDKFEAKVRENLALFKSFYGDFEYDIDAELEQYKEYIERIRPMITDTSTYLHNELANGKTVLIEGANGMMLDIDHGTYPFVTSSNATVGGALAGCGIPALKLTSCIGIMKAYTTRVGAGPFPSELHDELGVQIREQGGEYGATTGRPRRCGWFDAVVARYSCQISGYSTINLTKLDVLTGVPVLKIATSYSHNGEKLENFPANLDLLENIEVEYEDHEGWTEDISEITNFDDLPENAQKYVKRIEELVATPIGFIGVGMKREQMIDR